MHGTTNIKFKNCCIRNHSFCICNRSGTALSTSSCLMEKHKNWHFEIIFSHHEGFQEEWNESGIRSNRWLATDAQYQSSNKTCWNAVGASTPILWEITDCILMWKWKWLFVNGCESNGLISTVIEFLRFVQRKRHVGSVCSWITLTVMILECNKWAALNNEMISQLLFVT